MKTYLIYLNLANALDGFITWFAVTKWGGWIELNPVFQDNVLTSIVLVKLPVLLGISWILFHYDKATKGEKKFLAHVVIGLTLCFCFVVMWNWILMVKWIYFS